ncbi:MAG: histone deacetylase family protein, partial [bacterium]
HRTGKDHPEGSWRISDPMQTLTQGGLIRELEVLPHLKAEWEWVEQVHERKYLEYLSQLPPGGMEYYQISSDTVVSRDSFEAAMRAAGCGIRAVQWVIQGGSAFCLIRPPGHHARPGFGMGFCLLNNIAIATQYALDNKLAERVLILDIDAHHGNGTQEIFYKRPEVIYFSTHQYPFYPGTGGLDEMGEDRGKFATINVPLVAGAGSGDLIFVYENLLPLLKEQFNPDLVLVSTGFDIYYLDPLTQMEVTLDGMQWCFRTILSVFPSPIVFFLEGGYHPEGLVGGILRLFGEMLGHPSAPYRMKNLRPTTISVVRKILQRYGKKV